MPPNPASSFFGFTADSVPFAALELAPPFFYSVIVGDVFCAELSATSRLEGWRSAGFDADYCN